MGSDAVFIDTSAFKAIVDEKDDFHKSALKIWEKLLKKTTPLVTSNFIVDETLTVLRVKRNLQLAIDFREELLKGADGLAAYRVQSEDEVNAWKWFIQKWKKLSFTDCVCFAQMKRLGIDRVFTFDTHFKKAGFKVETI